MRRQTKNPPVINKSNIYNPIMYIIDYKSKSERRVAEDREPAKELELSEEGQEIQESEDKTLQEIDQNNSIDMNVDMNDGEGVSVLVFKFKNSASMKAGLQRVHHWYEGTKLNGPLKVALVCIRGLYRIRASIYHWLIIKDGHRRKRKRHCQKAKNSLKTA